MADFCVDKHLNATKCEPFCFLNVYKPSGITSFDVVYKLRKRFKIKKIGHSGTLDPLADGVMQVAIGRATRCLEYLGSDKKYIAKIRFGFLSSTGDMEGEITESETPKFTRNELLSAIDSMRGEIEQIPPVYSAIKVNGKKLYEIARQGKGDEVEIPKRKVKIYEAKLLNFNPANEENSHFEAEIEIFCSKGTYIRSYAVDLAKKLGTGGYLTGLTRTMAGNFNICDSKKIDEVLIEKDGVLPHLALQNKIYELNEEEYKLVLNGVSFPCVCANNTNGAVLSLVYKNALVSIGTLLDNKIVCKKVFN